MLISIIDIQLNFKKIIFVLLLGLWSKFMLTRCHDLDTWIEQIHVNLMNTCVSPTTTSHNFGCEENLNIRLFILWCSQSAGPEKQLGI